MYLEDLFRLFFKPAVLKGHILAIESMASLLTLIHDFGAFCRYNLADISLLSCGIYLQPTENLVCGVSGVIVNVCAIKLNINMECSF